MLYEYRGKVYIKPIANKLVEVNIKKDGFGSFNVIPNSKVVIIEDDIKEEINSISLEDAYKMLNKRNKF